MCFNFPYNKRVHLTLSANPTLVTDWYKGQGRWGTSASTLHNARQMKVVTPLVLDWFEATGFDVEFRASMEQCHLSVIFDDEMECKLFKLAFNL